MSNQGQDESKRRENIHKFQELVRVVDATLASVNYSGLLHGKTTLKLILFLSSFDGMEEFLPQDYRDLIKDKSQTACDKNNVRAEVKDLLMYPELTFAPWTVIGFDTSSMDVSAIQFKIQIVNGGVYAKCLTTPTMSDVVYEQFIRTHNENNNIVPNGEVCHITLVSTDMVYNIGQDKIQQFIDEHFSNTFTVQLGSNILSTYSRSWSVFSLCYVVEVHSPILTDFINGFSTCFGVINPTTHVTFAVTPRDLFRVMGKEE
jgi:hypothetical protein